MGNRDAIIVKQRRDNRGAHALALGLGVRGLENDLVGASNGISQNDRGARFARARITFQKILALQGLLDQVDDRLHRDAAGHLAGVVAAHAVGQHEQSEVLIQGDRILVMFSYAAGVGQAYKPQLAL